MKKVLTLALAAALAVGMSVTSFAATKYTDFAAGKNLGSGYDKPGELDSSMTSASLGDVYAGDEVKRKISLVHSMFDSTGDNKNLTSAELRDSKISIRSTVRKGSKVVKPIDVDTRKGEISIEFVTEWVSTKTEDFEITVYLTIDGHRMDDESITLNGTFGNREESVYGDYDYVDVSRGMVAIAEEFVPKIEVDLGNGVSIFTKLYKDKKYYGTANREMDESDDVVISKYPDIDNVVSLKTVGLNSTGDVVKLSTDYSDYYVYDKDMNYLGQADTMLPYSEKYYLANRKLDVGGQTVEESSESAPDVVDEEEPTVDEPKASEASSSTANDVNDFYLNNPSTGSSGVLNLAILAAAVSLAVVAFTRKK